MRMRNGVVLTTRARGLKHFRGEGPEGYEERSGFCDLKEI